MELQRRIDEWKHVITLFQDDCNNAMEKSYTKQMSITQYVRDRELGIRGMRKQRFVKQAEVTVYEDGYTEWPDHVQLKIFRKIRKTHFSTVAYGHHAYDYSCFGKKRKITRFVDSEDDYSYFGNKRKITRFVDSEDDWRYQCIKRNNRDQIFEYDDCVVICKRDDYRWIDKCINDCTYTPCINIRIPTGINQTYIDLIIWNDFDHNIEYDDFRKWIAGNHHNLLLYITRYCTQCQSRKCKCPPEIIYEKFASEKHQEENVQLPYSMELDYDVEYGAGVLGGPSSGMMALLPPRVNVSARGEVPVTLQVFRIRLPCSGVVSAEIPLALRLNVTAPPGTRYNDTVLVFKRNKICLKGVETPPSNDSVRLEPDPLANGAGALYVAATCACALILVVGSVASALYIRNSKARVQESQKTLPCCSYSAADTGGLARSSVLVRVDPRPGSANSGSYATIADLEPLYARPCGSRASYYAASHVTHLSQSTDPCEKARALAISRTALYCRTLVQEGTFGRVYKGTLELAGREQEVIIKTVTEVASAYQASLLVVEGSQLAGLVHSNIASLAAACLDSSCPLLAYTSTPGELNLKIYLTDGNHHPVTRDLVHVGAQVARAGAFLHGRGLLHRDIAARNCLIEPSSLRVRLADAALARDLFPQDYHCLGDNENRPIRWMALESLQRNEYSTATDVWSFGVFLWELATLGQQPYVEVDPFEMMACLRDGYRLAQPRPCPDELFACMEACWLGPSRDRPTMPQLLAYLQDFHDALGGFI